MKEVTLLFLLKENQILLAMKKRGFGEGKWNGVGGKIEPNETPEQATIRECQEEINITPSKLIKVGEIDFLLPVDGKLGSMHAHVFKSYKWGGKPAESDEMSPAWYNVKDIPYNQMWPDDKYWLPVLIAGRGFRARFELNDEDEMLDHSISTFDIPT